MFSYVRGTVKGVIENQLTVDVHGVGFCLFVANPELFQKEKEVTVAVHMQWNQEQGPTLYGFANEYEKAVFLLVVSCSGIGPKIALLVLQNLSPTHFLRAIQTADIKTLSSISGIGPKKAEQLIMQLKHKVTALLDREWSEQRSHDTVAFEQWKNITQVLQSLNYSRQEVDQALSYIAQESQGSDISFDVLMRKALSFLAKRV
jgi:Holliday junction DNA helicase RuvA